MTIEDVNKELLVVHRNSPIGREYDHFYSVSSVNNVIEKLVNRINELERDMAKKDDIETIRQLKNGDLHV